MLATQITRADLQSAPWVEQEHLRNRILAWQVPEPKFFPTGDDGPNIYLLKGEWLCWENPFEVTDIQAALELALKTNARFWKLTDNEMKRLYRGYSKPSSFRPPTDYENIGRP